jgi:hypothetical protein
MINRNIIKPNILDRIIGYFAPRYAEKRIQARCNINIITHQGQMLNTQKGRRVISSGIIFSAVHSIEGHIGRNNNDEIIDLAKREHDSISVPTIKKNHFSQ